MASYSRRCRWFDIVRHQFVTTVWPLRGQPAQYLEIGCFEAMSTVWMMTNVLTHPGARCITIDPWEVDYAKRIAWEATEQRARSNLAPWPNQVTILKDKWPACKPTVMALHPGQFDVIYVDAVHTREAVYTDATAAWPLLKNGGLMLFDDWRNEVPLGTSRFLCDIDGCYQTLSQGMQLHIRKVSDERLIWNKLHS